MLPPKSREHRLRVLQNQVRLAAERAASGASIDPQTTIPLLVEIKSCPPKQRSKRPRTKSKAHQADLGDI
jgi:hypothetical protein